MNPGETREGVRVGELTDKLIRLRDWLPLARMDDRTTLADAVNELTQLAAAREELEAWKELAEDETDLRAAEARADRLEAALERVREWAEDAATKRYPLNYHAKHVLSLIEHGPDDGLSDG